MPAAFRHFKTVSVLVLSGLSVYLGLLNLLDRMEWRVPADGVRWTQTPEGVEVEAVVSSHVGQLGLLKGDRLVRINSIPIGSLDDRIFLDTTQGLLGGDDLLMNWTRTSVSTDAIDWASTRTLSPAEALPYRERFRGRMLTVERWLQDLHGGRFFGTPGVIVVDVASLLMLILAGTGIALWWRSRRG